MITRQEPTRPGGAETILIVEDEEPLRLLVQMGLVSHGYTVLAARGAEQAIEIARGHAGPIALLITDVQMPGMRGPDLAARIATLRPAIKVLVISGSPAPTLAGRERLAPALPLLGKPFSIATLGRKVRELLDPA